MNALLLAAGIGSRLRPVTNQTPKCLVPILNKPLLGFWLDLLENSKKIESIYINTHYLANQVEEFIKRRNSKKKINLVYEPILLGTAGTIKNILKSIEINNLLVAHADNLSLFNIKDFINAFEMRPRVVEIIMMTFITDDPHSCGIVKKNNTGIVNEFYEKKTEFHGYEANGAVFIFSANSLGKIIKMQNCFDISKDILPGFLGRISTFENNIYHRDIGSIKSYTKAKSEFKIIYDEWKK